MKPRKTVLLRTRKERKIADVRETALENIDSRLGSFLPTLGDIVSRTHEIANRLYGYEQGNAAGPKPEEVPQPVGTLGKVQFTISGIDEQLVLLSDALKRLENV